MSDVLLPLSNGERPDERSDSFIDDDADFVKLFVGQASIKNVIQNCTEGLLGHRLTASLISLTLLTQIPKDMNEELLLPFFSEFGPVAELTVIRDKINQSHKGCQCFISHA